MEGKRSPKRGPEYTSPVSTIHMEIEALSGNQNALPVVYKNVNYDEDALPARQI